MNKVSASRTSLDNKHCKVYMEIKDLKPNTGDVDIVAKVINKEEPRTFEKFGKSGQVCNAKLKDGSGEIKLTLWNEDIEKINVGDKVHLENGWCSEFKGDIQISTGRRGKITVVEQSKTELLTNDTNILNQVEGNDTNILNQAEGISEDPEVLVEEEKIDDQKGDYVG